jgi:hypothetical protein
MDTDTVATARAGAATATIRRFRARLRRPARDSLMDTTNLQLANYY